MRGRDAWSLLALGARSSTCISGVLVDCAPDGLPDGLEFGLDESESGRLSRKDALVKILLVFSEERF